MTKRLNIFELHRTINEKNLKKSECYEKVLDICHRKVTTAAEHKQLRILFEVPEYVYGYPIFSINDCISFLMKSLKSNGFLIKYYFPKVLYISWDFDEIKKNEEHDKIIQNNTGNMAKLDNLELSTLINQNKQIQNIPKQKQIMPQLTSSLINPKQTSAALKIKPTGRLALNIY